MAPAFAEPTTSTIGLVSVVYDATEFSAFESFSNDPDVYPLSVAGVSVTGVLNGVRLDFNGLMNPNPTRFAGNAGGDADIDFRGNFLFVPAAGYRIVDYTVTLNGEYTVFDNVYGIALASASSNGVQFSATSNTDWRAFEVSSQVLGMPAPFSVLANVRAGAGEGMRDTGEELEFVDYFGAVDLDTVSVVANVTTVPEAQTYVLMLLGLAVIGAAGKRSGRETRHSGNCLAMRRQP
jgi:hypothetical protein